MIRFHCSSCHHKLKAPDGTEGRKIKCPECQTIMEVPQPGSKAPKLPPYTPPTPSKKLKSTKAPKEKPRRISFTTILVLGLAIALSVLFMVDTSELAALFKRTVAQIDASQDNNLTDAEKAERLEMERELQSATVFCEKTEELHEALLLFASRIELGMNYDEFTDTLSQLIVARKKILVIPPNDSDRQWNFLEDTDKAIEQYLEAAQAWSDSIKFQFNRYEYEKKRDKALDEANSHLDMAIHYYHGIQFDIHQLENKLSKPTDVE